MKGLVLLLLVIIAACASPQTKVSEPVAPEPAKPAPECSTKECFIASANECKDMDVTLTEDAGVFKYASKDCVFTKTLMTPSEKETAEMKALLQGKSLTCRYEKGKFDDRWATSIIFGTENCEGELKDILIGLMVFA